MTEPKISMMRQLYDLGNQIKWFFFGRADERAQNDSATNYEKVKRTFIYLVIAVDLIVVIFLTQCPCLDCGVSNSIASFLITSSAVLVAGILIGFLFGIPKKQKAVADTTTASSQSSQVNRSLSYYDDNTNLEEISDWLTKIIIGLSLIEFQQIRDEAIETSQNIAKIFICMPPEIGYVIGFSTLIFFSGQGLHSDIYGLE
jgi:hypothetical protein